MNKNLKKIEEILENEDRHPTTGGIRRNNCRKCGGLIGSTGKGLIRELCSDCGSLYRENRCKL